MTKILRNEENYVRLEDGSGNALSSTAGALNISGSFSGDVTSGTHDNFLCNATMQIADADLSFGQANKANSLPVAIASDQDALSVNDSTAQASLSTIAGDTTSMDAKLPASLGQKAKAGSLAVTLASDEDALNVSDSTAQASLSTIAGDTTSLDSKFPSQGSALSNASVPVVIASDQGAVSVSDSDLVGKTESQISVDGWSAASTGVDGTSTRLACPYTSKITFFGNVNGATTITLQMSDDDTNWYDSAHSVTTGGSSDFSLSVGDMAAQYVRAKSSADVTATLIISGKV